MVRRADLALRAAGIRRGIAGDVTVLDPACGPGVFLAAACERGARRAVGLDLDPDAVADAQAVLFGAGLASRARVMVHDTLSSPAPLGAAERAAAARLVIGNPPWAARTANRDAAYAERLLEDWKREPDGRPLEERKIGVLSDDYVRFWRWAAEEVRLAKAGVVALVTNASFLDGPVHRGMRACLMRWFDRIEVIDLGGSALIAKAKARDENLFGVRPAVAIVVASRRARRDADEDAPSASVTRAEIRGRRDDKIRCLDEDRLELDPIAPSSPLLAFVRGGGEQPEYDAWPSLPELMPFHREGVQTNRDAFVVDADRDALLARLAAFARGGDDPLASAHVASPHYDPALARAALERATPEAVVRRLAYRPFDVRWAALVAPLCHRPRPALLDAMERSSFAILTVRKDRGEREWSHFGAAREVVDNCWLSSRSSCRTRAFPTAAPDGQPNLSELGRSWGMSAEDLARYVLAWLAAPAYRARYDARLRADYPRIPPPGAGASALVAAGERVRAAFEAVDGSDASPIRAIGHREVRSARLAEAVDAAERAALAGLPLLERGAASGAAHR
ncbi:MAG: type ISP restriction/modification enzyme [Sandaracinaceae bacterium]